MSAPGDLHAICMRFQEAGGTRPSIAELAAALDVESALDVEDRVAVGNRERNRLARQGLHTHTGGEADEQVRVCRHAGKCRQAR